MKTFFVLTLLTVSVVTFGQNPRWQLSVQLQPEITFHKKSYHLWNQNTNRSTLNSGVAVASQYNVNPHFFLSSGVGFFSRKLRTANFLNQAALPPPRQSFTLELVTTKSVSFRVISIPITIGYYFQANDKFKSFVTTGLSGNYLLNTRYQSNSTKYDGAYKKMYWQGYSATFGLGTDYTLSKKIQATSSLLYAFVHEIKNDEYLLNRDGVGLNLRHKYLNLNIGIKYSL